MDFIKNTRKIYTYLQDDLSKEIYANRLKYNLTGDEHFLRDFVMVAPHVKNLQKWLEVYNNQPIYIYGAGQWGTGVCKCFQNIGFKGFIDENKAGTTVMGLPVLAINDLKDKKISIVVSIKNGYEDVIKKLINFGILESSIYSVGLHFDNYVKEYFEDFLPHSENEVFIDAGVYNGDTTLDFVKWSGKKFKHIYMFEPSLDYYDRFFSKVKDIKNCFWIKKGLGEKDSILKFFSRPDSDIATDQNLSGIDVRYSYQEGKYIEIPITSIDESIKDEKVTFIKMDIEGSELSAIKGGENTIKKYHPKMAICLYHKTEDLWTIPQEILRIDSSYKFYVRHYSFDMLDTVLYAI